MLVLPPAAGAQVNEGPINAPSINGSYYVGSILYPTIQSAVTAACAKGNAQVVIPFGVYPFDTIAAAAGCASVSIDDRRYYLDAFYQASSSAYSQVSASLSGLAVGTGQTAGAGQIAATQISASYGLYAASLNPATSSANVNSATIFLIGQEWNGTNSNSDSWNLQNVLGNGTNPTSTLLFSHLGTPGAASVQVPVLSFTNSGAATALTNPWGWSPSWVPGGKYTSAYDSVSSFPAPSTIQIQRLFSASSDATPDFSGAAGASMPIFEVEGQCAGGHNLQCHAIAGYMVNNGSQDSIGVSGRVYRAAGATSATSGLAEAAGVYGSAYQMATTKGYTMAGELSIFQNVTGTTASDTLPNPWSLSLHLNSQSTGSQANAAAGIDAGGSQYGYWNGIVIDPSTWNAGGNPSVGAAGTVAINGGGWSGTAYPQTGIKMGNATQHLWCNYGSCVVNAANGTMQLYGGSVSAPTTGAGLQLYAGSGQLPFLDFYNGSTHAANIFFSSSLGYFVVQSQTADTHINVNGGTVWDGTSTAAANHTVTGALNVIGTSSPTGGVLNNINAGVTASTYTIPVGQRYVEANANSTYTLPNLTAAQAGMVVAVLYKGASVTLSAPTGNIYYANVNEGTSFVNSRLGKIEYLWDGGNWYGISDLWSEGTLATACTYTAGAIGNSCTTTVTFSPAMPDTNYTVSPQLYGSSGTPIIGQITNTSTTQFTVQLVSVSTTGTGGGTLRCALTHE